MKNRSKKPFKKVAVAILCGIVFGLFLVPNGCDKLRNNFSLDGLDVSKTLIPITDYSLDGTECNWNFSGLTQDSVYVINDSLELLNFVSCIGSNTPPFIDFDQYSLLLVQGSINNYLFSSIAKSLTYFLSNYVLDIEISLNDAATIFQQWHIAIVVSKLPQNAVVMLNVGSKNGDGAVPYVNCISFSHGNVNLIGSGILYMDSLPANLQPIRDMMYIVYDKTQDKATIYAPDMPIYGIYDPYPLIFTDFEGEICHFPDFAKKWNIPPFGKPIYYNGIFYETTPWITATFPWPGRGKFILTILK